MFLDLVQQFGAIALIVTGAVLAIGGLARDRRLGTAGGFLLCVGGIIIISQFFAAYFGALHGILILTGAALIGAAIGAALNRLRAKR